MVKNKVSRKRIAQVVVVIILLIVIVIGSTYLYKNNNTKNVYFQKYDSCKALADKNPIRSVGGVKSVDELPFIVNCFENKGCYVNNASACDPVYPGISFTETFNGNNNCEGKLAKRCFYSPEYFNMSS